MEMLEGEIGDAQRDDRRGRYPIGDAPRLLQTGYYGDEEGRNNSTVLSKLPMFTGLAI
jgi:hypothetical protein